MLKPLTALGISIAVLAAIPLSQSSRGRGTTSAPTPSTPTARTGLGGAAAAPAPARAGSARADEEAPAPVGPVAGIVLGPVPAGLRQHLGTENGVFVEELEPGSVGARAGLQRYDIVLSIDGLPADEGALRGLLSDPRGAVAGLVRGGVVRSVPILPPADAIAAAGYELVGQSFLSTADLTADHPFRRYGSLTALQEDYSSKREGYAQLLQELEQDSREARKAAKAEMKTLEERATQEVDAFLEARLAEYLARAEERLADERLALLADLAVDLDALVPPKRVEAVSKEVSGVLERLGKQYPEQVVVTGAQENKDRVRRTKRRLGEVGKEMSQLVRERVEQPLHEALQNVQRHRDRLGPRFASRRQSAAKQLVAFRGHMDKRLRCAVKRVGENFARELRGRLEHMEVPQPGEVEAALADSCAQIEDMTESFLDRFELALLSYVDEVGAENERFGPAVAECLELCESSAQGLQERVQATLDQHLEPGPIVVDASWENGARIERMRHALRADLRKLVNAERNDTRWGASGLRREFEQHRAIWEDSWRDFERLLWEIVSQAGNDCWKVQGPHLDGRFPEKKERPRGEVVYMRR